MTLGVPVNFFSHASLFILVDLVSLNVTNYHFLFSTLAVPLPAQRSAQELPQVEKSSLTSCLVSGGEEMVITGSNFFPESKVIFLEKGPGKCYVHTAAWT